MVDFNYQPFPQLLSDRRISGCHQRRMSPQGLGSKHHQVLEGLPEANSDP